MLSKIRLTERNVAVRIKKHTYASATCTTPVVIAFLQMWVCVPSDDADLAGIDSQSILVLRPESFGSSGPAKR
jgi:hypothetical protein